METISSAQQPGISDYAPPATVTTPRSAIRRVDSVDLLRGIVMVIMLLDDTRDFVHNEALAFDPTDLTKTYPALFFTRWITHFCAPIFVFLAGTGSYFQLMRGKSRPELSSFLLKRGFWLIFLEFTVVRLAAFWTFDYRVIGIMQVIWALGWSMIVLSFLIRLPFKAIAAFGIGMIVLHNLTDGIRVATWQGPGSPVPPILDKLWMTLHQGGAFPVAGWPSPVIVMFYPLIPWFGVMAAGYCLGRVYEWPEERRRSFLMKWGGIITVGFVVIRLLDLYGDPNGWSPQGSVMMTIVSFLNVQKYPPSLLFLMMTLGPALMLLSRWEGFNTSESQSTSRSSFTNALITFGRVPLFFYILQWVMAHGMGALLNFAAGNDISQLAQVPPPPTPPKVGFDLWVVYVAWIVGTILLYPLCRWYAGVKSRRRDWWLSYL